MDEFRERQADRGPSGDISPVMGRAAGAAMRMAQAIVARLNSPYASGATHALHLPTLWRQVSRRLGLASDQQAGAGLPDSPMARPGLPGAQRGGFWLSPLNYVWRARRRPADAEAEADGGWGAPVRASRSPLVTGTPPVPVPLPQPTPEPAHFEELAAESAPPVLVPAQVVRVEYEPGPAMVAPQPLVAPPAPPARPPLAISQTIGQMLTASAPAPAQRMAVAQQPAAPPASYVEQPLAPFTSDAISLAPNERGYERQDVPDRVAVEHTPSPTAMLPLSERATNLQAAVSRALSAELNQDLVPTDHMLNRWVRSHGAELPAPPQQQPEATPVHSAAPVAAPTLPMPLAVSPSSPMAQAQAQRAEQRERERGPVASFFDRVLSALPMPQALRRVVQPAGSVEAPTAAVSAGTAPPSPVVAEQGGHAGPPLQSTAPAGPAPAPAGSAPAPAPALAGPAPAPVAPVSSEVAATASVSVVSQQPSHAEAPSQATIAASASASPMPPAQAAQTSAIAPMARNVTGAGAQVSSGERAPRGLLATIVERLTGGGAVAPQGGSVRPPAIAMPWVRRSGRAEAAEGSLAASEAPRGEQRPPSAPAHVLVQAPQPAEGVEALPQVAVEQSAPVVDAQVQQQQPALPQPPRPAAEANPPTVVEQAPGVVESLPPAILVAPTEAVATAQQPARFVVDDQRRAQVISDQPATPTQPALPYFEAAEEGAALVAPTTEGVAGYAGEAGDRTRFAAAETHAAETHAAEMHAAEMHAAAPVASAAEVANLTESALVEGVPPVGGQVQRGLFAGLVARLLGGSTHDQGRLSGAPGEGPRPPAISMPWVRRAMTRAAGEEQGPPAMEPSGVSGQIPPAAPPSGSTQPAQEQPSVVAGPVAPLESAPSTVSQAAGTAFPGESALPGPQATPAPVQPAQPTAATVQPLVADAAPMPPTIAPVAAQVAQASEPTPVDAPVRKGLFRALADRLLGSGEADAQPIAPGQAPRGSRPPAISMPWVRPAGRQTQEAWQEPEAEVEQPVLAYSAPPSTIEPVASAQAEPQTVTQYVEVPAPGAEAHASAGEVVQDVTPAAAPASLDVGLQAAGPVDYAAQSPAQPVDGQPAYAAAREISTPSGEMADLPTQALQEVAQAWAVMSGMAEELSSSHLPLSSVEPLGAASHDTFVRRLFGRLGHALGRDEAAPAQGGVSWQALSPSSAAVTIPAKAGGSLRVTLMRTLRRAALGREGAGMEAGVDAPAERAAIGGLASGAAPLAQPFAARADYSLTRGVASALSSTHAPVGDGASSPLAAMYGGGEAASALFLRPAAEMSPLADTYLQQSVPEQPEVQAAEPGTPEYYAQLLRQMYGGEMIATAGSEMPLAIPFGGFAMPAHGLPGYPATYNGRAYSAGDGASPGRHSPGESAAEQIVEYITPLHKDFSSPIAQVLSYSWSPASESAGAQSSGDAGEAGAWAGVISSAVQGGHAASAPALALAGEETGSPEPVGQQQEESGRDRMQEADQLAETVYSIIRYRLMIERERSY